MRTLKVFTLFFSVVLLVTGCGYGSVSNLSNNNFNFQTRVDLNQSNFTVVGDAQGQSSAKYILGIGGFNTDLNSAAYSNLVANAKIAGGSKALINVTFEEHKFTVFPFFIRRTVTARGTVVEFK